MQYKKIIWRDGQPINAGYLQQQTEYFETLIRHQNPNIYNWGFWEVEFDSEKFLQGEIALIKGRGIFPDGTLFEISEPLFLTIPEISTSTKVYLAIPVSNGQEIDLDSKSDHAFRYQVTYAKCQDITLPSDSGSTFELKMAMPNLQLLLETEMDQQWIALPVARIKLEDAQIVFDETYWAPSLNSFSDSSVTGRQLIQLLAELLNKLAQFHRHLQAKLTNNSFGGAFTVNHFLLHVVNKYQAQLQHLSTLPKVHPEQFFSYLLSLVTDLTALAAECPEVRYEHDNPSNGFTQLRQLLVSFVEQQINQKDYLTLTWFGQPYTGVTQFRSTHQLALTPNNQLILEIGQHFNVLIAAPDNSIQNLYLGGFEGISLHQLNQLPEPLQQRQTYQYYQLHNTNQLNLNGDYLSIYVQNQQQLGQNHELTLWFA